MTSQGCDIFQTEKKFVHRRVELWVIEYKAKFVSGCSTCSPESIPMQNVGLARIFGLLSDVYRAFYGHSCVTGVFVWNSEPLFSHSI